MSGTYAFCDNAILRDVSHLEPRLLRNSARNEGTVAAIEIGFEAEHSRGPAVNLGRELAQSGALPRQMGKKRFRIATPVAIPSVAVSHWLGATQVAHMPIGNIGLLKRRGQG